MRPAQDDDAAVMELAVIPQAGVKVMTINAPAVSPADHDLN
jgi:hypothetical protein